MPEATTYPKLIVLEGELFQNHEEYPANAALKPGHLVQVMSTGKVRKNADATIACRALFAKECGMIGRNIDTAYAADDIVGCHSAQHGHLIYAWAPAGAAAIVKGDKLKSDGTGCLIKIAASTDFVVGQAEEALDNSGGGAEARLKVRVTN